MVIIITRKAKLYPSNITKRKKMAEIGWTFGKGQKPDVERHKGPPKAKYGLIAEASRRPS